MKKFISTAIILASFCFIVLNSAFVPKHIFATPTVEAIKADYQLDMRAFGETITQLQQALSTWDHTTESYDWVQSSLISCRIAYKRIEFLTAYLDEEFVKDYINGAPLPKQERNAPRMVVLEPEGLQVIEEMIWADDAYVNKKEIQQKVQTLANNFPTLKNYHKAIPFTDRQVFEASRLEMIRILTLGLTGFDAPGAVNSIAEAKVALEGVAKAMAYYEPYLTKTQTNLAQTLPQHFTSAIHYLNQNRDFDTFDRLFFLKNHLNPLFKCLKDAHLALGIETIYETTNIPQSWNYDADNIFSPDLLNLNYYARDKGIPPTPERLALGRMLFFDPVLSENGERSCASCHKPEQAFTDGQKKSIATGFKGKVDRNAPTLLNAAYADRFFYDLRSHALESQIDHVIASEKEFHTDYLLIEDRLRKSEAYRARFAQAYPQIKPEPVSASAISNAMAAYVRSLKSWDSPFDRYVRGEAIEIDPAVKRGFNLFMGKAVCGTCHFAPTFSGLVPPLYQENESEILGVPENPLAEQMQIDPDPGRIAGHPKEEAPFYKHSFKTTTVRNVGMTAPYMHNGVYENLEEVVDFYNRGGGEGLGYEVPYQTLPFDQLNLAEQEIKDLVAFMEALTDTAGTQVVPKRLPAFPDNSPWAERKIGGKY